MPRFICPPICAAPSSAPAPSAARSGPASASSSTSGSSDASLRHVREHAGQADDGVGGQRVALGSRRWPDRGSSTSTGAACQPRHQRCAAARAGRCRKALACRRAASRHCATCRRQRVLEGAARTRRRPPGRFGATPSSTIAARVLRIARRVLLRDAGAVGAADQVDLCRRPSAARTASRSRDGFGGGVEARIGAAGQRLRASARHRPASAARVGVVGLVERQLLAVGVAAVERIGLAGAALVDQHDVALLAHFAQCHVDLGGVARSPPGRGRRRGRTPGRPCRRPVAGGQPGDVERDPAAVGLRRILRRPRSVAHCASLRVGRPWSLPSEHGSNAMRPKWRARRCRRAVAGRGRRRAGRPSAARPPRARRAVIGVMSHGSLVGVR